MRYFIYCFTAIFVLTFQSAFVIEESAHNPLIIADSSGNKVLLWSAVDNETQNNVIQVVTYVASTNRWDPPITISDKGQNAYSPKLAIDNSGNVVAAWMQNDSIGGNVGIYIASISKVVKSSWGTWILPVLVSSSYENVIPNFQLSFDNSSGFFLTWGAYCNGMSCSCLRIASADSYESAWSKPITLSAD